MNSVKSLTFDGCASHPSTATRNISLATGRSRQAPPRPPFTLTPNPLNQKPLNKHISPPFEVAFAVKTFNHPKLPHVRHVGPLPLPPGLRGGTLREFLRHPTQRTNP